MPDADRRLLSATPVAAGLVRAHTSARRHYHFDFTMIAGFAGTDAPVLNASHGRARAQAYRRAGKLKISQNDATSAGLLGESITDGFEQCSGGWAYATASRPLGRIDDFYCLFLKRRLATISHFLLEPLAPIVRFAYIYFLRGLRLRPPRQLPCADEPSKRHRAPRSCISSPASRRPLADIISI